MTPAGIEPATFRLVDTSCYNSAILVLGTKGCVVTERD